MSFSQHRQIENQEWAAPARHRTRQAAAPGLRAGIRAPRTTGVIEAIRRLDTELDPATRAEIARWIEDEYHREVGDIPLGFLATCYLGPPYVDHILDLTHVIVAHFAPADAVPEPFAQARMLVRTGGYAFVEVYASGELRPVLHDGTVVA